MKALRQLTLLLAVWLSATPLMAQTDSLAHRTMAYPTFRRAVATLADGRTVSVPQANVFLKGSVLVYRSPKGRVMEAGRTAVKSVDFDDRHYERIDTMLCWRVDTVGCNALYHATCIDMASLRQQILNSRNMTDLQMNSLLLSATAITEEVEDMELPYTEVYYFRYRDKWVRVDDRSVDHALPRNKRQAYKLALSMPGFSWSDPKSLLELLQAISD